MKRRFVGDFERMYQNEGREGFDSWHQEDSRQLGRRISFALIQDYNFSTVVDLGCGKGALTHLLKRENNKVFAVDIAKTAISVASARFPDIHFSCCDLTNPAEVERLYSSIAGPVALTFCSETLYYLPNWKKLLPLIAKHSEYALLRIHTPPDAIGFIKSESSFMREVSRSFYLIEAVSLHRLNSTVLFARTRHFK
ncbi:MAG: class I SAM-dependent methyltransferase [Elusimicrobiota bacterium]